MAQSVAMLAWPRRRRHRRTGQHACLAIGICGPRARHFRHRYSASSSASSSAAGSTSISAGAWRSSAPASLGSPSHSCCVSRSEPPRHRESGEKINKEAIGPIFAFLFSQRSFVLVLIGFCLAAFTNHSTSVWIPPFMGRVHHLTAPRSAPMRVPSKAALESRGRCLAASQWRGS